MNRNVFQPEQIRKMLAGAGFGAALGPGGVDFSAHFRVESDGFVRAIVIGNGVVLGNDDRGNVVSVEVLRGQFDAATEPTGLSPAEVDTPEAPTPIRARGRGRSRRNEGVTTSEPSEPSESSEGGTAGSTEGDAPQSPADEG